MGGRLTSWTPSSGVRLVFGPERLEEARHDVDLDTERRQPARELHHLPLGRPREGEHDAVERRSARRARRSPSRRRSTGSLATSARSGRGDASTNPTTLMRNSGCCKQLASDDLPRAVGPDDDARSARTAGCGERRNRAPERAIATNAIASAQNTIHLPRSGSASPVTEATTKLSQTPSGHQLEDADEIVDRRVLGPLLVSVVQTHRAGEHEPDGQAAGEEQQLPVQRHLADLSPDDSSTIAGERTPPRDRRRSATISFLRTAQPRRLRACDPDRLRLGRSHVRPGPERELASSLVDRVGRLAAAGAPSERYAIRLYLPLRSSTRARQIDVDSRRRGRSTGSRLPVSRLDSAPVTM